MLENATDNLGEKTILNQSVLDKIKAVYTQYDEQWPLETRLILAKHNQNLLRMLEASESLLDSFALIPSHPKEVKKEFDKALAEYGRIIQMCIEYVQRHIKK